MGDDKHTFFIQSIRGKIIIASVLACFTLLLAWGISKFAFKQMLNAVEKISAPNDKLRLVNELTHKVAQLDQVQKSEMLDNPANYYNLFKETKKLLATIDTLQTLFADDEKQVKHIISLKKLLIKRDKLFINYLKVREGLVNNKTFSTQVKMLNDLVNKSARQNDSTVTTTEKDTQTTTIIPEENKDSTKQSRGFFSKLFGKKKQPVQNPSYKVVQVEINTKQDTLAVAKQDSILKGMSQTMSRLEKSQVRRSAQFIDKEAVLNKANNRLIRRILSILKQVEAEAVQQVEINNSAAKNVVNTSVNRISYIIVAAFLLAVVLLYFILRDISRINQYKRELEIARDEAEYHGQAKQRFLSNMSHEIRTPLQSIIGYTELLKQQVHPRKSDIDAIYQSSEHLMQIVNEVLDYNRIISGKFTISSQVFSITELLNEVVSVMYLQAVKKSISLVTDYNIPIYNHIEGDAFRLKQILYNLLGNAIKFTEKGEVKLSISCTEAGNELNYIFTVSDTGIGLSDKDITRIFNEFEQVPEPGSNYLKGTGLGLTITKSLIEVQGGNINVKSELGQGSSFTFNLNYKKAAEPIAEPEKQIDRFTQARQGKIWVIDDDNFILELCSTIFERNGIRHRCFSSPHELLNTAIDPAVKFILMDIRLPEMSGTELCKILRERISADVLIFALTAQTLPGECEFVLKGGFDGMLMKPFKERDLLTMVMQHVVDAEAMPEIKLDINKVEKMTFGDKRQLNKILKRFTEDCIDDIAELRLSMENYDNEKLVLLVHRIAGRTAQIGATDLAADFRIAEMDFLNNDLVNSEKIDTIILLTNKLQILVKQVRTIYLNDSITEAIT
jgi:signal transduction histidine kinase/DNA-binding response OmpR family regulator